MATIEGLPSPSHEVIGAYAAAEQLVAKVAELNPASVVTQEDGNLLFPRTITTGPFVPAEELSVQGINPLNYGIDPTSRVALQADTKGTRAISDATVYEVVTKSENQPAQVLEAVGFSKDRVIDPVTGLKALSPTSETARNIAPLVSAIAQVEEIALTRTAAV